jgi:Lipoprotein amino terminal region
MADLLNSACAPLAFRKYTSPTRGRYCTKDQFQLFQRDLVPLLVQDIDRSEGVDRMSALANIGLLASEDIVAILLPHVRGDGSGDHVAYRARAILSLHGIFHKIPERVYPLLLALADNIAERPEVRMVAVSILLNVQVPINVWQRVASRTWFEPNQQVRAFIYNMIVSYTRLSISTPAIIAL